jgi:hypothetical protein
MRRRRPQQFELPLLDRCRESVTRAYVALDGRIVEYTIRRSARRRTITLTIDERGLRVGAPWHAAEHAIVRQINRHAGWVLSRLAEWAERRPAPRRWEDGETIMLLGEPLRLTLLAHCRGVERQAEQLIARRPEPYHVTRVKEAVTQWLRGQALSCFAERVAHFAPMLGVQSPAIRLSDARTRWGSCHPAGYILLNWRLIHFPQPLLDYVVVHELAHLLELNHSARFWRLVAAVVPDHAERRAAIRTLAHEYLAA